MVDDVRPRLTALERAAFLGSGEWDGLLSAGERVPIDRLRAREAELEFDDAINIQDTSGTTGFPKGATLSHHNILNNAYFVGAWCGHPWARTVRSPGPFYPPFGMRPRHPPSPAPGD